MISKRENKKFENIGGLEILTNVKNRGWWKFDSQFFKDRPFWSTLLDKMLAFHPKDRWSFS